MSSRRTSAAMAAPPAGAPTTTAICAPFRLLNAVRDALGLVAALGYRNGRGGGRARFRRLGGGLVRAGAARCVPLAGADERAVRRTAGTAVRHRRQRREGAGGPTIHEALAACRGRASITSGTTRPGRRTPRCGNARRGCTTSCAPTTTTKAPTGRQPAAPARRLDRRRNWRRCRPTTSWTCAEDMPAAVAPGDAVGRPRSPPAVAPEARARGLRGEYQRTGFQGGLNWYRSPHRAARSRRRTAAVLRPDDRRAVDVHRRHAATGASTRRRARSSDAERRLHAMRASI